MLEPPAVIDGSDGVWCRPVSFEVSVWPPGVECIDAGTWKLTVEYRGRDLWGVTRGGFGWICEDRSIDYSRDGVTEPGPGRNRFPLREAIAIAHEEAPKVTVNGMTSLEVLEHHRQRHGGDCDA
jgi:hypothetical protein